MVMNIVSKDPAKCASISEILVMQGANVNLKNNDNFTPLHAAIKRNQEKGVQIIIQLNKKLKERNRTTFDLDSAGGVQ